MQKQHRRGADSPISSFISHHSSLQREQRFTLIELLMVVAIIAILAGMLLPALTRARAMARQAKCAGMLRQISAANAMYQSDWKDFFCGDPADAQKAYWMQTLEKYIHKAGRSQKLNCPDAPTKAYGMHENFFRSKILGGDKVLCGRDKVIRAPASGQPLSTYVVFMDGQWPNVSGWQVASFGYNTTGFIWNRHANAVNVTMIDGHVERCYSYKLNSGKTTLSSAQAGINWW